MTIHHSTPYKKGNIGGGINDFVRNVRSEDDWICIRDGDTMFLTSFWGNQVERLALNTDGYELIGCVTNRIGLPYQLEGGIMSEVASIAWHKAKAEERAFFADYIKPLADKPIAGFFMLFPKRLWTAVGGFEEETIYFDIRFTAAAREKGFKVGIAQGLYIFHMYRWGAKDPRHSIEHLQ